MNPLFLVVGSLALALSVTAVAESFDATAAPASASDGDRAVVAAIVMDAVTDAKLCALATDTSQNVDVRSLCRNRSADDERIALQGMQLAAKLGATDAALEPAPQTPQMLESLARYTGREFDRHFLLTQIAHDGNFAKTIRYSVEFTSNIWLKRYESAVLTTVGRHTDSAENVLRRLSESSQ